MDPLISTRRQYLVLINKKIPFQPLDFTSPVDHRVKIEESEKTNTNMWMTVIPIVIGALGTVPKALPKGAGNKRNNRDHCYR